MSTSGIHVQGKVALVTGGSKGIGFSMADGLARFGADLAIVSRNRSEGEQAAATLRSHGRKIIALRGDVTQPKEVEQFVSETVKTFGRIDVLVNNAGMNIRKPALDVTEEDWDRVVDTNLKGAFFTAQAVGRVMVEQRGGKIINVSSIMGSVGRPWLAAYCSSKGGINQLTKVLALEWAPFSICVNAIAPAYIRTPMTGGWLQDPERYRAIVGATPLGRVGDPEDLVGAVVFLASDWSNYVTGTIVGVDGGWLAQ